MTKAMMKKLLCAVLVTITAVGCGPQDEVKPTTEEVTTFKGKELTPEQIAKGKAAALGGAARGAQPQATQ